MLLLFCCCVGVVLQRVCNGHERSRQGICSHYVGSLPSSCLLYPANIMLSVSAEVDGIRSTRNVVRCNLSFVVLDAATNWACEHTDSNVCCRAGSYPNEQQEGRSILCFLFIILEANKLQN
eukprot:GHRQ01015224.1.p2 GENE.GHRQ01015224.1~~GHRQ01015224.1.p2  ORF type:complete len:121 (-),score=2.14 GHRQ01015224.1:480-842(-)